MGREGVQASVAETARTAQTRIIPHRYAVTLRSIRGWMEHPPAMRDGTAGYEWHKGPLARCLVHLQRDAEVSLMENDLGSSQYDRHRMMLSVYRDAGQVREQAERLAGGPVRCASHLGIIARIPGLAGFVDARIDQLAGRVRMITGSFPADGVTTTIIPNALPNMFAAIRIPGMPLHNNAAERAIRDLAVAVDRRRAIFPNRRAARNFAILRTFAATCVKNGITAYQATIRMARDPTRRIFTNGIPPPVFGGGAAPKDEQAASAEPDPTRPRLPSQTDRNGGRVVAGWLGVMSRFDPNLHSSYNQCAGRAIKSSTNPGVRPVTGSRGRSCTGTQLIPRARPDRAIL